LFRNSPADLPSAVRPGLPRVGFAPAFDHVPGILVVLDALFVNSFQQMIRGYGFDPSHLLQNGGVLENKNTTRLSINSF
jgi:hypothetical protein